MVIINTILAVSDIVIDLFAGFGMGYAKIIGKFFYSIATLGVYLLAAFAILFLLCLLPEGEAVFKTSSSGQ